MIPDPAITAYRIRFKHSGGFGYEPMQETIVTASYEGEARQKFHEELDDCVIESVDVDEHWTNYHRREANRKNA